MAEQIFLRTLRTKPGADGESGGGGIRQDQWSMGTES